MARIYSTTNRTIRFRQETNPVVFNRLWRKRYLGCSYCGPNKGENENKSSKFRQKGWKVKTRQQHQYKSVDYTARNGGI